MNGRFVAVGYGLWATLLALLYFVTPANHALFSGALSVTAAAAVCLAVRRYRPRRRAPWLLIAAALLMFTGGDVIAMWHTDAAGVEIAFPSLADAFYLAFYPLLAVGLLRLLRSGAALRDRAGVLDSLTLTAAAGLFAWIFLIAPLIRNPDLTPAAKAVAVAYPVCDLLLLTVLIRMTTTFRRSAAVGLLTAALAVLLTGDVLYAMLQLNGEFKLGGLDDLCYLVCYTGVGAAALHPSMVRLTEPRVLPAQPGRGRVAVLGLASFVPPTVLLVEALHGQVRDGMVIAVLSVALFATVVARLAGVVAELRLAITREFGLRHASAAMLAAATVDDVDAVVRAALAELLPNTAHRAALVVVDPDAAGTAPGRLEMVHTGDLPPPLAADFADHPLALRCPLPGRRRAGYLYVAADEAALIAVQEAAQVLATQASLALDGVSAAAEIVRRESDVYFRALVLHATDVILIVEDDDRIRYASPSALALFGADPVGGALPEVIAPHHRDHVAATLAAVRGGREAAELDDWSIAGGAGVRQAEVSCRDLRHERSVAGLVITLRDVTDRRRLEQELLERAYRDPLTGLPNRAALSERLVHGDGDAALLLIGLDDFAAVNDSLGHDIGDDLLGAVGRRLSTAADPHTVARPGGDDFAVLVEGADDAAVQALAERLLRVFDAPFTLAPGPVTCRASIGVVTTADVDDRAHLLGRADVALSTAKSAGKGGWCRYDASLHTTIVERLGLRAALSRAVTDGQLVLAYQPLVELASGRTTGFEALVRWQHPTRGTVPPMEFIGLAEESGLIVPLGAWVLQNAVATATAWREIRPEATPYVSVNVSPRQFREPGFVDLVVRLLAESGLPADCLLLEITESLLLSEFGQDRVREDLDALRRMGVRVAIDDFGTGYSSLSYLHAIDVDMVKLDKSFVDTISTSAQQYELVKGIVGLVHTLGVPVLAEGVETELDRDLLVDTGCEYGQGYLFARPMSDVDARQRLLQEVRVAAS